MYKFLTLFLILFFGCSDPEVIVVCHDFITDLGFKVQSNGYEVDLKEIDSIFLETERCLGYSETRVDDIYIVLKEPNKPFECESLPETGCGGLYKHPVLTVSADLQRLAHEYIHLLLRYYEGSADPEHLKDYNQCS